MIREVLEKKIRKLVGTLKEESELTMLLKARLTKRENKLLQGIAEGLSKEEILGKMKLDGDTYASIYAKLIKKLNQEKLKQELTD